MINQSQINTLRCAVWWTGMVWKAGTGARSLAVRYSAKAHPHILLASRRPRAYKRILPRAARLGRMAQGMPNRPMEFRLISL
ncbi:hypothetical protein GCM10007856_25510 [Azospirillum oryzae]|nr:hypothetical protein GCM10007856_25510 [Azospirillum oryzae]